MIVWQDCYIFLIMTFLRAKWQLFQNGFLHIFCKKMFYEVQNLTLDCLLLSYWSQPYIECQYNSTMAYYM